jgi:hypothetical protein
LMEISLKWWFSKRKYLFKMEQSFLNSVGGKFHPFVLQYCHLDMTISPTVVKAGRGGGRVGYVKTSTNESTSHSIHHADNHLLCKLWKSYATYSCTLL